MHIFYIIHFDLFTSWRLTSSCYFSIFFSVVIIKLYVSSFRCRCCVQFWSNFYTLSYNRCSHTLILFFLHIVHDMCWVFFTWTNMVYVREANGIYYIYKRQNGGFCRFCFSSFFSFFCCFLEVGVTYCIDRFWEKKIIIFCVIYWRMCCQ